MKYLYLVLDPENDLVKYGESVDPDIRLLRLRHDFGPRLVLIYSEPGTDRDFKYDHSFIFLDHPTKGDGYTEWFIYDDRAKRFLNDRGVSRSDIDSLVAYRDGQILKRARVSDEDRRRIERLFNLQVFLETDYVGRPNGHSNALAQVRLTDKYIAERDWYKDWLQSRNVLVA